MLMTEVLLRVDDVRCPHLQVVQGKQSSEAGCARCGNRNKTRLLQVCLLFPLEVQHAWYRARGPWYGL